MATKKKDDMSKLGEWAFIAGLALAVLVGLPLNLSAYLPVSLLLVLLGLVVGAINVGAKETHGFLLATVALLVASTAGLNALPVVGSYVTAILQNIVTFVAPAAVVVALKAVYEHGK